MNEVPHGFCHCGCGQKTKLAHMSSKAYGWVKGEPFKYIHGHRSGSKRSLEERLREKVTEDTNTGCWLWGGTLNDSGYGIIMIDGSVQRAHRVSYEVFKRERPGSKQVCHSCDNPRCINPDHLWLGTHNDNIQDAVKKGRMHLGEKHGMAKLTENDVREIRNSPLSGVELAKKFKVGNMTISNVRRFKVWKHVQDAPQVSVARSSSSATAPAM